MDAVLRGLAVYLFVYLLFRLSGRRTVAQITTFDFVLLLIISEAAQNGMVDDDHSLTNSFILVTTLVVFDIGLSLVKQSSKRAEKILDDVPLVVVEEGEVLQDRMKRARVDVSDVLHAARMQEGLERMADVKYAVVERSGGISIVPKRR